MLQRSDPANFICESTTLGSVSVTATDGGARLRTCELENTMTIYLARQPSSVEISVVFSSFSRESMNRSHVWPPPKEAIVGIREEVSDTIPMDMNPERLQSDEGNVLL